MWNQFIHHIILSSFFLDIFADFLDSGKDKFLSSAQSKNSGYWKNNYIQLRNFASYLLDHRDEAKTSSLCIYNTNNMRTVYATIIRSLNWRGRLNWSADLNARNLLHLSISWLFVRLRPTETKLVHRSTFSPFGRFSPTHVALCTEASTEKTRSTGMRILHNAIIKQSLNCNFKTISCVSISSFTTY